MSIPSDANPRYWESDAPPAPRPELVLCIQAPPRTAGVARQLLYYSWTRGEYALGIDDGILLPESGRCEITLREGVDVELEVASVAADGVESPGPTLSFRVGRHPVKSSPGAVRVVAWRVAGRDDAPA